MDLQGSGDIHFDALQGLASLTIDLDGSGDIVGEKVEVSGKTKISVSGSGDVRIVGQTEVLKVEVVGSGDVDAAELDAGDCEVKVMGSGDVNVNCKGGPFAHHGIGRYQQRQQTRMAAVRAAMEATATEGLMSVLPRHCALPDPPIIGIDR